MVRRTLHKAAALLRATGQGGGEATLSPAPEGVRSSGTAWRRKACEATSIEQKRVCLQHMLEAEPDDADTCLMSYGYPALRGISETLRRDFAFSVVWKRHCYDVWDEANEPLAVILGSDFVLNTDVNGMRKQLYGHVWKDDTVLPITYEEREQMWPELRKLSRMSLASRKVFVRVMQCFQIRSGFAECRAETAFTDGLPMPSEVDQALRELAEVGLIDLPNKPGELLMTLTSKELKQFAFDHGINSSGPKQKLTGRLVDELAEGDLHSIVAAKLDPQTLYVRPIVSDARLLKKYIWAEVDRIQLYTDWVRHFECSPRGAFAPPHSVRQHAPRTDDLRPWGVWGGDPREGLTRTELSLAHDIWDPGCDAIVWELADKYAWDAPWYIGDAISNYMQRERLEGFKEACEREGTHVWYNLLMYYGQVRLMEMGFKCRQARLLNCAACGKRFLESSIPPSVARRVDHRVHFCASCYRKALFATPERERCRMSEADMLRRVGLLAAALEGVPTASLVKAGDLRGLSEDKQIETVKALLSMPDYQSYVDRFGSWLRALIQAGVLEDGTQPSVLGTRCMAVDGHECFSLAEKTIDDWFSLRQIVHEKEPAYPYDPQLNPTGMRADWRVGGVFIEYAGLMDEPEYAAKMEVKGELCDKLGVTLIIIEPQDVLWLDEKLQQLIEP
jgi:hypothetical protein